MRLWLVSLGILGFACSPAGSGGTTTTLPVTFVSGAASPVATSNQTYTPVDTRERRCLPALVCASWAECAAVVREADRWVVEAALHSLKGEFASVEANVCTSDPPCPAARLHPVSVQCAPTTVPPLIPQPDYRCEVREGRCQPVRR